MARSLFRDTIVLRGPAGLIPLAGAQVWFYEPNGGTPGPPISYPLYPDAHSAVTLPTPYVTGALGELEVWADLPHRAQIVAIKSGYAQVTETIDLEYPPELSATTDDIADAIRIHESEEDPHDQYLTQDEADLAYLKLTGGVVTGPVTVASLDVQAIGGLRLSNASLEMFSPGHLYMAPATGYVLPVGATTNLGHPNNEWYTVYAKNAVFTESLTVAGNGVETLNHKGAASGYVPLGADTKIPNAYLPDLAITNTFVVTSEAEMLALTAQTGDVCVRLDTTENYILAAEPATVLANWTKLAASTTAGNTTIVKREEFAPSAASTAVALAAVPTQMLAVSRNGVEQSQPAGHYTVAGVTVTFTDAFVAGERVSVVYEVGSSAPAPVNGYTKLESDARYEPIDTMYTKAESDAKYALTAHNHTGTYLPLTGGTLTGLLTITVPGDFSVNPLETRMAGDTGARFRIDSTGTVRWGTGTGGPDTTLYRLGAGSLATGGHFSPDSNNTRDLGSTGSRWRKLWATDVESTNVPTVGGVALPTSAGIASTYLPLAGGTLSGQLKFGADVTLQRTGVGALRVDTHLGVGVNPGAWNASWRAIQVGVGGALMTSNIPQTFLASNSLQETAGWKPIVADKAGVMIGLMETGMFVYTVPAVAAGVTQAPAARMALSPTGTLTLTPDAGQPSLNCQTGGGGAMVISQGAGNVQNSKLSAALGLEFVSANGMITPGSNNNMYLGYSGLIWNSVWAGNGVIQTSVHSAKEAFAPLDPTVCAAAVLETDWVNFAYRPPTPPEFDPPTAVAYDDTDNNEVKVEKKALRDEGEAKHKAAYLKTVTETAFSRHQKGYVLKSPVHKTHDLFGLEDRESTSVASDLAVVACALQEVLRRLAIVEGKVV